VYTYVVTSIATTADYQLIQKGSAPNFAGGRITLCTCKHKDRATFHPSTDQHHPWKNVWVAGLTSKTENPPRSLAYLMFVTRSFLSHREIWRALPDDCRQAKSASHSTIGDLFKPKACATIDPYDPANYFSPVPGHVHSDRRHPNQWHQDVMCWGKRSRPHHLLLGQAAQSYQWTNVKIILKLNGMGISAHHRKYDSLKDFIANLQEFDP
jgi:hypothetical protein